jgi:hypothetical protein
MFAAPALVGEGPTHQGQRAELLDAVVLLALVIPGLIPTPPALEIRLPGQVSARSRESVVWLTESSTMTDPVRKSVALSFAALLGLAQGGLAQEPKKTDGPNSAKASAEKPKADEKAKAVARLAMAHELIAYGRETKSPESLILAAKILGSTQTNTEEKKLELQEGQEIKPIEVDPAKLLAEAKKMDGSDGVADLAAAVSKQLAERSRGSVGGPCSQFASVGGNGFAIFRGVYRGGELACASVVSFDNADLDLYVFDENGNLIAQDRGPCWSASCTWSPFWTGRFTLRVVNCSPFPAGFRINTN